MLRQRAPRERGVEQRHESLGHLERAGKEGIAHKPTRRDQRPQAEEADETGEAQHHTPGRVQRAGHSVSPLMRTQVRVRRSTSPSRAVVSAPKMATQIMPTRIMPG